MSASLCCLSPFSVPLVLPILVFLCLLGSSNGRGGTGRLDVDDVGEERTYPSMIQRYYYTYYVDYFTPSGFYYAKNNLYNARTITICTNYEPFFHNETYLGEFPCPMENDPEEFTHCCGDNGYEYCCKTLDALPIRIGIGFAAAAGLGLIVGTIACIVVKVKNRKQQAHINELSKDHMCKKGIPKYETRKNKNYVAEQSIDGYQILVVFKRKPFYQRFYEELRLKYVDISWRYDDTEYVTEGKLSLDEDNWVNLILCDDYEGSPVMIVMREKPSVTWMTTEFEEICTKIPDESGLLSCCGSSNRNKTHPAREPTSKAQDASKTKELMIKESEKLNGISKGHEGLKTNGTVPGLTAPDSKSNGTLGPPPASDQGGVTQNGSPRGGGGDVTDRDGSTKHNGTANGVLSSPRA